MTPERGGKPPCPQCGSRCSAVIDGEESRTYQDAYRRRRQCAECRRKFTTLETVDPSEQEDDTPQYRRLS